MKNIEVNKLKKLKKYIKLAICGQYMGGYVDMNNASVYDTEKAEYLNLNMKFGVFWGEYGLDLNRTMADIKSILPPSIDVEVDEWNDFAGVNITAYAKEDKNLLAELIDFCTYIDLNVDDVAFKEFEEDDTITNWESFKSDWDPEKAFEAMWAQAIRGE